MAEQALEKRTHVYVQRPREYEVAGCPTCGNANPDWSEYKSHLWCQNCKVDFKPEHYGVLDGPVCVQACELLGIYFDRIHLETGEIEAGPSGVLHFEVITPTPPQELDQTPDR